MKSVFSLIPEQASQYARQVDDLYIFITLISIFFTILAAALVIVFIVKYRRRSESEVPEPPHADSKLEIAAGGVLLVLLMVMFGWGAWLFFAQNRPPADCMEILVVGKQWMWKVQHPSGKKEINNLHVPAGQNVKLTMTSEDVIHDFFIPAMRVKNDAVPGRYTTVWFNADKPGTYRLFCAEYCGTQHSQMGGWVTVMPPAEYEAWVRGPGANDPPEVAGGKLFVKLGCVTCHAGQPGAVGPTLAGTYGSVSKSIDGTESVIDDAFIRESILNPTAKVKVGFEPKMPVFKGQVTEEQIMQLAAYIKSLGISGGAPTK